MSFPEWGYSYNALYVPLSGGWHCALMPFREAPQVDRGWRLSYEERKQEKKERDEQLERDRQDFDRLFEVRIDRRSARTCSEFREYVAFINLHLRASSWDLLDGEGITRILRVAVRDGHITPVIARNWHGGPRVFRHYAPQRWPRAASGVSFAMSGGGSNAPAGRFTGPFAAAMHAADTVLNSRLAGSGRTFSSEASGGRNGFDWLGALDAAGDAVAGTALGSAKGCGDDTMRESFCDSDGGGSSLGDAQPFEYQSESSDGAVTGLSARGVSEANETECFADYEMDMEMCSAGGAMYKSPTYYLECKARAFQRYQQCRGY
ncbi:hypothetical protein IAG25_16915 [Caballeronia sp. EK]|uniref:hypothetical protein n=1 Tax=Caballeronia sp. EK TaxID=2767469 RepID=UPI00165561B6|nr:hypothetical protein [Caballeronia sp. EK]MBC8638497.1 hypothetical protein [Caballeronia sp. EK]